MVLHPPAFLELTYQNPLRPQLGLEAFRLSELRRRMPAHFFQRTQRLHFHLLALYIQGSATLELDFETIICQQGTLVHVYPAQVLRYLEISQAEAHLLLFQPEFIRHDAISEANLVERAPMRLGQEVFESIHRLFQAIEEEYQCTNGESLSPQVMQHLLQALLFKLNQLAPATLSVAPGQQALFQKFRQALEIYYASLHSVQEYASLLGCSAKTLQRATANATGQAAKPMIDQRLALEAKRLLAHTALNNGEIAQRLQFSESTNFIKFFRRQTGQLPGQFRKNQQSSTITENEPSITLSHHRQHKTKNGSHSHLALDIQQ